MIAKSDLDFVNWVVHGVGTHWIIRGHTYVRADREEARDFSDGARVRRETAAKDASVCADCGRRFVGRQPATMTTRNIGSRRAARWLYVPICRRCANGHDRTRMGRGEPAVYRAWREAPCLNCRRPIRACFVAARLAAWTCCADCEHRAALDRNNERRRVRHRRRRCVVDGRWFTPTRADARFCSSRCRQAAHRRRHRP